MTARNDKTTEVRRGFSSHVYTADIHTQTDTATCFYCKVFFHYISVVALCNMLNMATVPNIF